MIQLTLDATEWGVAVDVSPLQPKKTFANPHRTKFGIMIQLTLDATFAWQRACARSKRS